MAQIYLGNDHEVSITGLKDSDDTPLVAATVEATLLLAEDMSEVAGITWPITLTHTGTGNYEGVIDKAVSLVRKRLYVLRVTASEGTADAQWDIELLAEYRDG